MSHILAIEDDRTTGRVLKGIFEPQGHRVDVVAGLSPARRALSADTYELVLLDLCLPDGLGFEMLQFLEQRPDLDVPVVVLSGLGHDMIVARVFELGATDFVVKPFSPSEILARLDGWLATEGGGDRGCGDASGS